MQAKHSYPLNKILKYLKNKSWGRKSKKKKKGKGPEKRVWCLLSTQDNLHALQLCACYWPQDTGSQDLKIPCSSVLRTVPGLYRLNKYLINMWQLNYQEIKLSREQTCYMLFNSVSLVKTLWNVQSTSSHEKCSQIWNRRSFKKPHWFVSIQYVCHGVPTGGQRTSCGHLFNSSHWALW